MHRIQKFLLQPRGHIQMGGRPADNSEGTCSMKRKKVVGQIEVEGEISKYFHFSMQWTNNRMMSEPNSLY